MSVHILKIDFGTPAFDEALELRNKILRVPLGLEFYPDDITLEYNEFHFGAYAYEYNLCACLSLKKISDSEIKMRQVAVAEKYQRKGIGQQLVYYSEEWARRHHYHKMILHARDHAISFYNKLNYNF